MHVGLFEHQSGKRVDDTQETCPLMRPTIPRSYSIDYSLSKSVSEQLKGLDFVEAWLSQLLEEAQFLAQFDTDSMIAYLHEWCPDYRGLLINLYDPISEAWGADRVSLRCSFENG